VALGGLWRLAACGAWRLVALGGLWLSPGDLKLVTA